jgi:hypothetical protein
MSWGTAETVDQQITMQGIVRNRMKLTLIVIIIVIKKRKHKDEWKQDIEGTLLGMVHYNAHCHN